MDVPTYIKHITGTTREVTFPILRKPPMITSATRIASTIPTTQLYVLKIGEMVPRISRV